MRPVNLMPEEIRRRSDRRPTGPAPYILTVFLALVAGCAGAYVLLANQATSKRDRVSELTARAAETNREADALAPYGRFADIKQIRQVSVATIAAARFPWDEVLYDVSVAIPSDAWLVKATGKIAPEAKTGERGGGGSGGGGGAEGADEGFRDKDVPGPRITLEGCAMSQLDLADMVSRLRNIDGVKQVLLSSSELKGGNESEGGGGTGFSQDCRTTTKITRFRVTITFSPGPGTLLAEAALGKGSTGAQPGAGAGNGGESSPAGGGQPASGGSK